MNKNSETKDVEYDPKTPPMGENLGDLSNYVKELEDFIAELELSSPKIHPNVEDVSRYLVRGSKEHRLWQKLRLAKYPGDY